jgi:anti-repressor protein
MNELIKVNYENVDRPTVSGRELWEALEVETPYKKWFDRMAEYGFSEGVDFNLDKNVRVQIEGNRNVSREITDHQLTIPMAKELCMLQRTERGKFWRQYFIGVEEKWNSPEAIMARALQLSNVKMKQLETTVSDLQKQMEQDKPKVLFADSVTASSSSILIGELAKLIKRKGSEYNLPTQRSMEQGLMEIKETSVVHTGYTTISKTPKVTGKGQVYFINLFLGQA